MPLPSGTPPLTGQVTQKKYSLCKAAGGALGEQGPPPLQRLTSSSTTGTTSPALQPNTALLHNHALSLSVHTLPGPRKPIYLVILCSNLTLLEKSSWYPISSFGTSRRGSSSFPHSLWCFGCTSASPFPLHHTDFYTCPLFSHAYILQSTKWEACTWQLIQGVMQGRTC